jgi:hypothetical protein
MRYVLRGADGHEPVQVPHWKHMWAMVREIPLTFFKNSGLLSSR